MAGKYDTFLRDATSLLDIFRYDDSLEVLAKSIAPELTYFSPDSQLTISDASFLHQDIAHSEIAGALLALATRPREVFSHIRICAQQSFAYMRLSLLEAMRFCNEKTLILIENADRPLAAEALASLLGDGLLDHARIDGYIKHHSWQLLHPRGSRSSANDLKKTIVVAVFGEETAREWRLSGPLVRAYANKIGADLIVVEGDLAQHDMPLAKLVALDRLESPGRVLMIDTDVMINESCPDIFEITPADAVGLFIESLYCDRLVDLDRIKQNYQLSKTVNYYCNTGVIVIPEHFVSRFSLSCAQQTIYLGPVNEQDYINFLMAQLDIPLFNISILYNAIPLINPDWLSKANIIHFAGGVTMPKHLNYYLETNGPTGRNVVRAARELDRKIPRLTELRNAVFRKSDATDRFFATQLFNVNDAVRIQRHGAFCIDCTPSALYNIYGPYQRTEAGSYLLDILFSHRAYDHVFFGTGTEGDIVASGTSSDELSFDFDVVADQGRQTLVDRSQISCHGKDIATIPIELNDVVKDLEFRIISPSRPFSFYGMRLRLLTGANGGPMRQPGGFVGGFDGSFTSAGTRDVEGQATRGTAA